MDPQLQVSTYCIVVFDSHYNKDPQLHELHPHLHNGAHFAVILFPRILTMGSDIVHRDKAHLCLKKHKLLTLLCIEV